VGKSAKIIKIKPLYLGKLLELLKEGTEIIYGEIPLKQEDLDLSLINNNTELKTKITKRVKVNELGIEITAEVEDYNLIKSTGRKFVLKPTEEIIFFIYTAESTEGYIVIFERGKYLNYLITSLNKMLKSDSDWFKEITFNLHENEEKIRNEFGNFRRFYTRDMDHELVKNAILSGVNLEDSSDYRKYIKDYGGYLSALIINYGGIDIMITSRGRIWSPNKKFESQKYQIIKDIVEKLENAGVIQ